jgi:hypothetical protein
LEVIAHVLASIVCLVFASCSRLKRSELLDVTGCEEIKWGMTLIQAKPQLGSGAQIITDHESGKSVETGKLMIGDVELSGFVGTKSGSDRINGVYLAYLDEPSLRKISQEKFKRLKYILTKKYGPSNESPGGRICFWTFASGKVILATGPPGERGSVLLSYMENEFDPRTVLQD